MRKTALKKAICITMATLLTGCFTGCGEGKTAAATNYETGVAVEASETIEATVGSAEVSEETTEIVSEPKERVYKGIIAGKFPDADFIEQIADGRFVILDRDKYDGSTEVTVYDACTDSVLNTFKVVDCSEMFLTPVIFEGKGFGFITPYGNRKEAVVYGYYYDTDGNLVNKFEKEYDPELNGSYALASDGSAMYVVLNDRVQCACGYDFNVNYTTKILKVYADGSEDMLNEFDSHYAMNPLGTTDDGRLMVIYTYDPRDKVQKTHEEYERGESISIDEVLNPDESENSELKGERGLAFINTGKDDSHDLEKFYDLKRYYEHIFVRGNAVILVSDTSIIRVSPDKNGEYKECKFEDSVGLKGYYTNLYVSAIGDYVVYPTYSEEFQDTEVNVLHFDGDKAEVIFEKNQEGWKVEFDPRYRLAFFDEVTGDFCGRYSENAEGGVRDEMYLENAF